MTSGEDPAFNVPPGMTRRLAAILSADVAGYSRLMGADETATIRTLITYRDIIDALVQEHRGRVVNSPGDNLLAEFASVVDAVQCAMGIQRALSVQNRALPLECQMQFRIGINLGDVIAEGQQIYGDGVNIAARLESLAEAGGICISGTVYDQIATKLPLGHEFLGEQTVKNILRPVRVYRVRMEPEGSVAPVIQQRQPRTANSRLRGSLVVVALLALLGGGVRVWPLLSRSLSSLPAKPAIAVLPFVNMSGDPEQEYFSDGMTEDLITELSSLSGLFVIARNSVFTYKGRPVKPDQVSRDLGVRYMLEGSVRKANNRMRITAQLVDTTTGYHMWAQSYDRDVQDIFAVQEEIARRITRALAVRLTKQEETHMGRPYTSSPVAWEYFMRGAELYRRYTPRDNAQARALFEQAIALDSEFARAYANLAATHRQDGNMEWTQDRETSEELAYRLAQKAVELARRELAPQPSLPYALEQLGWVLLYKGNHDEARQAAEEVVQHNPNYADGYALGAHVLSYLGQPEEALRKTQEATRLNPKYPFLYDYHRGHAYYVWGFLTEQTDVVTSQHYYQQAETHLRESLKRNNNHRPSRAYLVAILSSLGRQDEAKSEMAILRAAGRPQASQDLKRFQEYLQRSIPYKDPAILARLSELWQAAE
jgi:adenylate cyclase